MPKTQSRLSTDDFLIPVTVVIPAGGNATPTNDVVKFAFVRASTPPPPPPALATFHVGFWINAGQQLYAGITVGPQGSITLSTGTYNAWLWIIDTPTEPVALVDTLTIV